MHVNNLNQAKNTSLQRVFADFELSDQAQQIKYIRAVRHFVPVLIRSNMKILDKSCG